MFTYVCLSVCMLINISFINNNIHMLIYTVPYPLLPYSLILYAHYEYTYIRTYIHISILVLIYTLPLPYYSHSLYTGAKLSLIPNGSLAHRLSGLSKESFHEAFSDVYESVSCVVSMCRGVLVRM